MGTVVAMNEAPAQPEWWWLSGRQEANGLTQDQWKMYYPEEQQVLTAQFVHMENEGPQVCQQALLADLGASGYQVKRGKRLKVSNTSARDLCGKWTTGGYPEELWSLPREQLPPSRNVDNGQPVTGFYQIRREDNRLMDEFHTFLTDRGNKGWSTGSLFLIDLLIH